MSGPLDLQITIHYHITLDDLVEAVERANDPEEFPGEEPVTLEALRELAADANELAEFITDTGPMLSGSDGALSMDDACEYLDFLIHTRREELNAC